MKTRKQTNAAKQTRRDGPTLMNIGKARKPKPQRFTKPLTIFLTPDQHAELSARAKNQNDSKSRQARRWLERGARKRLPVDAETLSLGHLEQAIQTLRSQVADMDPTSKAAAKLFQTLEKLEAAQAAIRGLDGN